MRNLRLRCDRMRRLTLSVEEVCQRETVLAGYGIDADLIIILIVECVAISAKIFVFQVLGCAGNTFLQVSPSI